MNTHLRSASVLIGIIAAAACTAFADEQMIFTGSHQHAISWIDVPTFAKVCIQGDPTSDPSSYIRGVNPVLSYYNTSAQGPVYFEGYIDTPGTYQFDQEVGNNGFICTHIETPNSPAFGGDGFFLADGYAPWDCQPRAVGRSTIDDRIEGILGIQIDADKKKKFLDEGCVGIFRILLRVPKAGGGYEYPVETGTSQNKYGFPELHGDPDKFGQIHAFLTLAAAQAYPSCGAGTHEVIAVKYGIWTTGSAPTPQSDGTVPLDCVTSRGPNADPNFDYWVLMSNGRWVNMNHGVNPKDPGAPQILWDFGIVGTVKAGLGRVFFKSCVKN